MPLKLITAPAVEPISLAEAKVQLGITDTDQDAVITRRITEAREWAESYTRRAFVRQTWDWPIDAWPASSVLDVPLGSLQTVDAISYYDADGALQTIADTEYQVDAYSMVGRIMPEYGKSWPDVRAEKFNPITIRFTAGYTDSAVASAITPGVTTSVALTGNPGSLAAGGVIRLGGFAGADAALVNGIDHTINSVTEAPAGTFTFVLATDTDAKTITLGAGVGADLRSLPGPVREAMLLLVGHWMNFQAGIEGGQVVTRVPYAVLDLLAPYVLPEFG